MRCVLSGVQSGRYLAPSSRALSRSSERKGFWKPLSTTTTPCRIFPSSWGPARAPLGSVPSRGFPGAAFCAGVEAAAAAGERLGTVTGSQKTQVQWFPGVCMQHTGNQVPLPPFPDGRVRTPAFPDDTLARISAELRSPVCLRLGLLRVGGPAEGLLAGLLSSRFKSSFLFPLGDS